MFSRFGFWLAVPLIVMQLPGVSGVQSQPAPLAFEVVTVKVNKPGERRELALQYLPGGRFSARAVPVPLLVAEAYDTARLNPSPEFRKLDVSAIERDLYDIEAVAPKDAIPPGSSSKVRNDKIKEMLRTLLADRFKLRVHYETKEQSVYALVVGKNGSKLSGVDECADRPTSFFDPSSCHSIADLIKFAQRTSPIELPLIDKTGLTGMYSIPFVDWSAIINPQRKPDGATGPTFEDILGRLGLRLETQKATVNTFFVDHIEIPTPDN